MKTSLWHWPWPTRALGVGWDDCCLGTDFMEMCTVPRTSAFLWHSLGLAITTGRLLIAVASKKAYYGSLWIHSNCQANCCCYGSMERTKITIVTWKSKARILEFSWEYHIDDSYYKNYSQNKCLNSPKVTSPVVTWIDRRMIIFVQTMFSDWEECLKWYITMFNMTKILCLYLYIHGHICSCEL